MLREIDKVRVRQAYQLLLEIAEGRFGYQIDRSGEDDELEMLVVLLNLMSEEMQHTLLYYSMLHTHDSTLEFVKKVIVLDQNFSIYYMNTDARQLLGNGNAIKENTSFSTLLSRSSVADWKQIAGFILTSESYEGIHSLTFKFPNGLTKKVHCSVVSIRDQRQENQYVLITSFEKKLSSALLEDDLKFQMQQPKKQVKVIDKSQVLKNEQDIRMIQKVYHYLLEHLEEPTPSLHTLARLFGTNENKLKYGFKQLYHTSVFRFVTAERLKKACLLIQNTTVDLKSISHLCGFKSYPHFSKAFKERYGYSPLRLRR